MERRSTVVCDVGSSPRLRGTRPFVDGDAVGVGIIPALAGNTLPSQPPVRLNRDHPRACGEHGTMSIRAAARQGSSPRLRGTPTPPRPCAPTAGIIPALAGNTVPYGTPDSSARDHPRACGEHCHRPDTLGMLPGSSPRLRGTPITTTISTHLNRIIPALAGNTTYVRVKGLGLEDHPRACGEHSQVRLRWRQPRGSSPRLRGTHGAT